MDFAKIVRFCAIAIATLEAIQSVCTSLAKNQEREKIQTTETDGTK